MWVALAVLRRARGIRGELVAESLGSDRDRFMSGLDGDAGSAAVDSEQGQPAELERSWVHQGSLVLKFVGRRHPHGCRRPARAGSFVFRKSSGRRSRRRDLSFRSGRM